MIVFDKKYFHGEGYKEYINFSHFVKRAHWIKENLSGNILEVGCAFGFLIQELDELGVRALGLDFSSYAISQASPNIKGQIILGDVSDLAYFFMESIDWIVSWNVLDCLRNEEHAKATAIALNTAVNQIHVICMKGQNYIDDGYFIRDYNFWRTLLPNAYLVCHECGTVYVPDKYPALSQIPLSWEQVSR